MAFDSKTIEEGKIVEFNGEWAIKTTEFPYTSRRRMHIVYRTPQGDEITRQRIFLTGGTPSPQRPYRQSESYSSR